MPSGAAGFRKRNKVSRIPYPFLYGADISFQEMNKNLHLRSDPFIFMVYELAPHPDFRAVYVYDGQFPGGNIIPYHLERKKRKAGALKQPFYNYVSVSGFQKGLDFQVLSC